MPQEYKTGFGDITMVIPTAAYELFIGVQVPAFLKTGECFKLLADNLELSQHIVPSMMAQVPKISFLKNAKYGMTPATKVWIQYYRRISRKHSRPRVTGAL